jgi:hypothetical protein
VVACVVLLALASLWQVRVVDKGWVPGGGAPEAKADEKATARA